jgi:hypothetical protein
VFVRVSAAFVHSMDCCIQHVSVFLTTRSMRKMAQTFASAHRGVEGHSQDAITEVFGDEYSGSVLTLTSTASTVGQSMIQGILNDLQQQLAQRAEGRSSSSADMTQIGIAVYASPSGGSMLSVLLGAPLYPKDHPCDDGTLSYTKKTMDMALMQKLVNDARAENGLGPICFNRSGVAGCFDFWMHLNDGVIGFWNKRLCGIPSINQKCTR